LTPDAARRIDGSLGLNVFEPITRGSKIRGLDRNCVQLA
jgi:hypothetical protein